MHENNEIIPHCEYKQHTTCGLREATDDRLLADNGRRKQKEGRARRASDLRATAIDVSSPTSSNSRDLPAHTPSASWEDGAELRTGSTLVSPWSRCGSKNGFNHDGGTLILREYTQMRPCCPSGPRNWEPKILLCIDHCARWHSRLKGVILATGQYAQSLY